MQPHSKKGPAAPTPYGGHPAAVPVVHGAAPHAAVGAIPGQPLTRQILSLNSMVGAIIEKVVADLRDPPAQYRR